MHVIDARKHSCPPVPVPLDKFLTRMCSVSHNYHPISSKNEISSNTSICTNRFFFKKTPPGVEGRS
jgi:hypothetical protein